MEQPHNARDPDQRATDAVPAGTETGMVRQVLRWGIVIAVLLVAGALLYFYI
jgi:hypothetical protein